MVHLSLRTHSPSPSTTCYAVRNTPSHTSPVPKLLHLLNLASRLMIAGMAATILAAQVKLPSRYFDPLDIEHTVCNIIVMTAGEQFCSDGPRWFVPALIAGAIVWACSRRSSVEESLLIIRGLGIQTSSSSSSYLSTPTTRFIPTSQVQDIFIHEAFIGFSVKFYLAVIVEGEEEAVVVFPKLLPGREVLEEVWRGARNVLGWSKG